MTWEEAVAYCQELGGYMATISSDEENEFLYEMLQESPYSDAYFGYTDVQEEGVWKWVNGEETTYTNWQDGEPNDENGIEEYAMFYHMTGNSRWNDGSFQGYKVNNKGQVLKAPAPYLYGVMSINPLLPLLYELHHLRMLG